MMEYCSWRLEKDSWIETGKRKAQIYSAIISFWARQSHTLSKTLGAAGLFTVVKRVDNGCTV